MISAAEHPKIISSYLENKVKQNRVLHVGSEQEAQRLGIHCSPFGVIPKKNRPDKWRLIVNLSAPEGRSINDGIDKELASLSYVSVDDVAACMGQLGKGAVMAKNGYNRHTAMFQFIRQTGSSWVCRGKGKCTWMWPSPLVSGRHH